MDEIEELKAKLERKDMSLLRAWDALQRIRKVVADYRGHLFREGHTKSFEEEGQILEKELRQLIEKTRRQSSAQFHAMNAVMNYLGRTPRPDEMEKFKRLKAELQLHLDGMGQYTDEPKENDGLDALGARMVAMKSSPP